MHYSTTMIFMFVVLVLSTHAAVLVAPPTSVHTGASPTVTAQHIALDATVTTTTASTALATISSLTTYSPLITIAPLSRNPLELRQKCFNDQGFSVNCATWTGYYYTWGGAGHPYAGGPGDSGSGSSNGNSNTNGISGIISQANRRYVLVTTVLMAFTVVGILIVL